MLCKHYLLFFCLRQSCKLLPSPNPIPFLSWATPFTHPYTHLQYQVCEFESDLPTIQLSNLAGALHYIKTKGKTDMKEKISPSDFAGFTPEEWKRAYESSRCPTCGNAIIEELLSPALLSYSCYSCKKRVYLKLRQMERMLH